jgi:hypothetical protein
MAYRERFNATTRRPRQATLVLLVAALLGQVCCFPAVAEEPGFWTRHRIWGTAFLGGGLFMVKRGYDFKTEGDDIFKRYKKANTTVEADRLFDQANDQDIKSQISWGVAAALTVSAVRLLLINPDPDGHTGKQKRDKDTKTTPPASGIRFSPQLEANRWGIQLQQKFF